jgi:hypothetical protein
MGRGEKAERLKLHPFGRIGRKNAQTGFFGFRFSVFSVSAFPSVSA